MPRFVIAANFHVYAPVPGAERAERREFLRGQVVTADDVPAGQSIEDWIEKGLAAPAE